MLINITHGLTTMMPTFAMKEALMKSAIQAIFGKDVKVEDSPEWKYMGPSFWIPHNFQLIAGVPHESTIDELTKMNKDHPTLLLIGAMETATVPEVSMARAKEAGIPYKSYPKGTHFMYYPYYGDVLAQDILAFLKGETVEDVVE